MKLIPHSCESFKQICQSGHCLGNTYNYDICGAMLNTCKINNEKWLALWSDPENTFLLDVWEGKLTTKTCWQVMQNLTYYILYFL